MKKTLLFGLCLGITVSGVAQLNRSFPAKRVVGPTTNNTVHQGTGSTNRDVIWTDDFSDPGTWVIDHPAGSFDLDWQVGIGLENAGDYPTAPIESTTAANGYAMVDSDGGFNTSGIDESAQLTTANPIDLSAVSNVVLEFENHYRKFPPEACYVVVSTDGTFPALTPSTDISGLPNVFRLFANLATNASTANPEVVSLDISDIAGNQSTVWIRFHWTGQYGYSWFVDDVALIEQLPYELIMNYGVISHTGNGEEYGRVPQNQLNADMNFGAQVFNFGSEPLTGLQVQVLVEDAGANTIIDQTFPLGDLASGATADLNEFVALPALSEGVYDVTFAVGANESALEDNVLNNIVLRQFGVDNDQYAADGIGVYADNNLLGIGSESFTGAADGLEVMSYYELATGTTAYGVEAVLANGTVEFASVIVSLFDTADVFVDDLTQPIAQSDVITVTQADLDAGSVFGYFFSPAVLDPGAYYASVRLFSADNLYPITILDDTSVPQPNAMSLIYIPGDQVYTNGNASAVRLLLANNVSVNSITTLEGVSMYPNPTEGMLRLNSKNTGSHAIEVTNMVGARVLTDRINSGGTIDLSAFAKGVYMVRITNNEGSMVQRVTLD